MAKEIVRCTRCVMSSSADPTIHFDEKGQCNYCTQAFLERDSVYFPNQEGQQKLDDLVKTLKENGRGKPYDCIMGLSGGLDSSYLLYLGHQLGLRILGVHIDDGFDTEISKGNLEKLVKATGIDYSVVAPDGDQFYALSKAYMKAGVPNLAAPQDNVLFAEIYSLMRKKKLKYFLSGGNWALESILQRGNTHTATDVVNIKDIGRRFGAASLSKLKFISAYQRVWDQLALGIQSPRPLNYIDYNRKRAFEELEAFCGFAYYGSKHLENSFTAFVQLVWFPQKFGVDKRTSHLSSLIVSGQMTRPQALEELAQPLCDPALMEEYIADIKAKLLIGDQEYEEIMAAPTHQHTEYKTDPFLVIARRLRMTAKQK